jgi:hypothetical protein
LNAESLGMATQARARRSYEAAMLRLGVMRAALVTGLVAALAALGLTSLPATWWLAPLFAVWVVVGWRGALMWRGALGGLAVGLGALALPMSVLRPCCATMSAMMTGGASCSMPEVCVAAGAALGLAVAATLPRLRSPREWAQAAGGAMVAVVSLVACRCADMVVGESVGLLGGLLASSVALAMARAWWAAHHGLPQSHE